MTNLGDVYLAASRESLPSLIARVRGSLPKRPRVAVSYAAVEGDSSARQTMETFASKAFAFADLHPLEARENADLIFLAGGDPVLGANVLTETGIDGWLRDARRRGTATLGVSAGAMMLCAAWASWPDDPPPNAPFAGGSIVRCACVVPDLIVDCHAEDDDWVELRGIAEMLHETLEKPRLRGIPTGAGLIVHNDGSLEAVGKSPFEIVL